MNAADPRALLAGVAGDRRIFPHQLDLVSDRVLLVRLAETQFAAHSFLDQRVLTPATPAAWVPWAALADAARTLPALAPAWIFHVGHCGSTLLSRLVAAATDSIALREPLLLRSLVWDAAEGENAYLDEAERCARIGLFGRLCRRGGPAVVKATSMATSLVNEVEGPRLFLCQQPEVHLALVLSGPNSIVDLRGFAPVRRKRLAALGADVAPVARMRAGELAAAAWLCETATALSAVEAGNAGAMDFDAFLDAPAPGLAAACRSLGLAADEAACDAVVRGPLMQQYSKAPEHAYDAGLRCEAVAEGRRLCGEEIRAGLAWLERTARAHPLLSRALDRFGASPTSTTSGAGCGARVPAGRDSPS